MHQIKIVLAQQHRQLTSRTPSRCQLLQPVGKRLHPCMDARLTTGLLMQPTTRWCRHVHLMASLQRPGQGHHVSGVAAAVAIMEIGEQELQVIDPAYRMKSRLTW